MSTFIDVVNDYDQDYKDLIKAVVDNAIVDYIKLQHPSNRNKKYLEEGFLSAIHMFFDEDYVFEAFLSPNEDKNLTTKDLLSIMIGSNNTSVQKAQEHAITESINYWWDKNFHDLKIPSKVTILGKVWFIHYSELLKVDHDKLKIYLPIKKVGSDRLYIRAVLEIILKELDIVFDTSKFDDLLKAIYLFLKVNNAFPKK